MAHISSNHKQQMLIYTSTNKRA